MLDPIDINLSRRMLLAKEQFELYKKGEVVFDFASKSEVWTYEKMSKFIESILLRFPLENIFAEEDPHNRYIIIDGKRRLKTIFLFLDNDFALCELKFYPDFNGKKFSELPRNKQRIIEEVFLTFFSIAHWVSAETKEDFKNRVK